MIRLFQVLVPVGVLALLISEVILLSCAYVLASYIVLEVDPTVFLLYDGGLVRVALVVLSLIIGMHFHDLYSKLRIRSRVLLMQQLSLVVGSAFLFQALVSYVRASACPSA